MNAPLTIAVSKGRILEDALPLLARAGITPRDNPLKSRLLRFPTNRKHVELIVIRAADVPT
ncbi:MAG: ATP phosphoribosyltransferase, partial [Nevskiales bacterium]